MTSKVKDVLLAIAILVSLGCFFYGYIQQIRATGEAKNSMELRAELEKQRELTKKIMEMQEACEQAARAAQQEAEKNKMLAEDLLKKSKK